MSLKYQSYCIDSSAFLCVMKYCVEYFSDCYIFGLCHLVLNGF